jgi:hypothetical protein
MQCEDGTIWASDILCNEGYWIFFGGHSFALSSSSLSGMQFHIAFRRCDEVGLPRCDCDTA